MARIFNLNKTRSFFSKKKETYTDTCCDTSTTCCDAITGLRYGVFYSDGFTVTQKINTSTESYSLSTGAKWNIYLEVEVGDPDVTINSITLTPISPSVIPEIGAFSGTPITVTGGSSQYLVSGNFATPGIRVFSVTVDTDAGNMTFQITLTVS